MGAKNSEIVITWLGAGPVFGDGEGRVEIGEGRLPNGDIVTCKISAQDGELISRAYYRLFGRFVNHPTYGKQWIAKTFIEEKPLEEETVVAYLCQCKGAGKGSITRRVAIALWEKYGPLAIDEVINTPSRAAEGIKQWGADKAAIAREFLSGMEHKRVAKMGLIGLFDGRGFPKKTVDRVIRVYGITSSEIVRDDPYVLMQFQGIGFKAADKLYCDIAREKAGTDNKKYQELLGDIRRQGLCLCHEVAQDRTGSTWVRQEIAKAGVRRNISGALVDPDGALEWAVTSGRIVKWRDDSGSYWVANAVRALHEQEISWFVSDVYDEDLNEWPDVKEILNHCPDGKPLSEHQTDAITKSTMCRVGCLQGSPGVGKTFGVATIVKAVIAAFGSDQVSIACPTGKAAVRATQALHENGVHKQVSTIHRMLGVESQNGGGFRFTHNESNPLPFKFVVIDECFIAGTQVDTPDGPKPIESLGEGEEILNAFGVDEIAGVSKKEVDSVAIINVGKEKIVCSKNHRFFTRRGWVVASEIRSDDSIIRTESAMRLMRDDDTPQKQELRHEAFLQHLLLNEMVDAIPRVQSEIAQRNGRKEMWVGKKEVSEFGQRRSKTSNRLFSKSKANEERTDETKSVRNFEANRTSSSCSRWQWTGINRATTETVEYPASALGIGVCGVRLEADQRLPNKLQNRSRGQVQKNWDRSRWQKSSLPKRTRQKEGQVFVFERVESAEVLESGDPRLDQFRDTQGRICLYDIKAKRHQSFSVNKLLVHNCSMLDTDLMAAMLRACTPTTHVLFVGDINQLAPVGHGRPFQDLQQVVPTGHLTEIRRNSGRIVQACAEIRDHRRFVPSKDLDVESGENMPLIETQDPEEQLTVLDNLIRKIQAGDPDCDPVWDIQVLTALNQKSEISRKPVNELMQGNMNPEGQRAKGNPFRVNDKIVCLKNGTLVDATEKNVDHFIANGELGEMTAVRPGLMNVRMADEPPREAKVPHAIKYDLSSGESDDSPSSSRGAIGDWDLGYVLSVHRSQGSQWKYVIVLVDESGSASQIQSRNWLYTGISRAEVATFIIGKKSVCDRMMMKDGTRDRQTFLVERTIHNRNVRVVDYATLFAEV